MDNMQHLVFQNFDCEIHYWYRKGLENKWVLFFHGACANHEMFQNQFEALDKTYSLIAWDARGHGMSKLEHGRKFRFKDMISDCRKLYEIYNIDKAILIGQSMGGNLVQDIAYYYPELVDKLVLIDCNKNTGKLTVVERWSLKCSKFLFNCYPWKIFIRQSADACGNKDSVKKYIRDCFEKVNKLAYIDIMMELIGCLHEDVEFVFKQPVLLLCGSDDKLGNIKKNCKALGKKR
jgi:pimeloyl-ACP methyl ester carboxylesterase